MPYENLSDFLADLQDAGDLVRIGGNVSSDLELAAIVERAAKSPGGGPALVFENVDGKSTPVAANLLGGRARLCRAMAATSLDEVAERMAGLLQPEIPDDWLAALKLVPRVVNRAKLPPRTVKTAVCQQVVKMGQDINLGEFPIPRCWPQESHPVINAGQVYTFDPDTGARSVGCHPLQVLDRNSLGVHWQIHDAAHRNWTLHRERRRQMPVSVALGGDPCHQLTAAAQLPRQTDPLLFGGFLRGQSVDLIKCRSNDLAVPADAEIVLEGYVDADAEPAPTGPLGLETGFYSHPQNVPVLRLTGLTHRSNPLFPVVVQGTPPSENCWIQHALERIFLPLVKLAIPELVDYHLPLSGGRRNLLFVSITKEYPQQARKVFNAIWGLQGRLAHVKTIVVVDAEVDVQREQDVWFHVGANVHPGRDVVFCEGPTHMLDHATPVAGMGHKMGIDATRKLPAEGHPRNWPALLMMPRELQQQIEARWDELASGREQR